jgi:hypothetical protein
MDIVFTRSTDRADQTLVTRRDGVRLLVPVYGQLEPIPHDLAHYLVESELGLQDGFWASVATGVIFSGMRIVGGRQRPHAKERSREVLAANRRGILFAELMVDALLRTALGERLGDALLPIDSALVRTLGARDALVARLRPALDVLCAQWGEIPFGGTLRVVWPDRSIRGQHAKRHTGR